MRNQKGFTLIEIIAVLVILGILAAVAVPRFINMQANARVYASQGALAALAATATMDYAQKLLTTPSVTTYATPTPSVFVVGDFTGTVSASTGQVIVTVTSGPSWFVAGGTTNSKSFSLY